MAALTEEQKQKLIEEALKSVASDRVLLIEKYPEIYYPVVAECRRRAREKALKKGM